MKALTLYNPWATLVVLGEKQFETRSWSTSHRGLLAIHTSKKPMTRFQKTLCRQEYYEAALTGINPWMWPGRIIGTVEVVRCFRVESLPELMMYPDQKEQAFGDFSPYRFAWQLTNPQRLAAPIPCVGHMGVWMVPPEVEAELARQRLEHGAPRF